MGDSTNRDQNSTPKITLKIPGGTMKLRNEEELLGVIAALMISKKIDDISSQVSERSLKLLSERIVEIYEYVAEPDKKFENVSERWNDQLAKFKYLVTLSYNNYKIKFVFNSPSFLSGIDTAKKWWDLDISEKIADQSGNMVRRVK